MDGADIPERVGGARTIRHALLLVLALVGATAAVALVVLAPAARPVGRLTIIAAVAAVILIWRGGRTTLTLALAGGRFAAVGEHRSTAAPDGRVDAAGREQLVHHWMELLDLDGDRPPTWVLVEARHVLVMEASDVVAVWGEGSWWARVVINGPDFTIVPEQVGAAPP